MAGAAAGAGVAAGVGAGAGRANWAAGKSSFTWICVNSTMKREGLPSGPRPDETSRCGKRMPATRVHDPEPGVPLEL